MIHPGDKKMGEWFEKTFNSMDTVEEKDWFRKVMTKALLEASLTDEDDFKSECNGVVFRTNDYSMFKKLPGNRDVIENRKKKIKKSVLENGAFFNPILVNEKMEIIDGNGRFEVFSELGLPIDYIIKKGLSLKECIVFNSSSTSWTLLDYIKSYASQKNEDYERLYDLISRHKLCSIGCITYAINGLISGDTNATIKSGDFTVTREQYLKADADLSYAEMFLSNFRCGGNRLHFVNAIIYASNQECVDKKRLLEKWNTYGALQNISNPVADMNEALGNLERAYNYKAREGSTIYLKAMYDQFQRSRTASYQKRWSERKRK